MSVAGSEAPVENPASAFARLSRRTQIARYRQLAGAALAAYDLPPARLTLIHHLYNTTFRVDAADGARYMLRIHRSGTSTPASVGSELAWLAALRHDTDLEVPDPVSTRAGALLTEAAVPGVPQPHLCVLFRWLPGRILRHGLAPRQMEQVGALMAHLHDHAAGWPLPPGFTRSRVDWPIDSAELLPDPFVPEVVDHIEALVAAALSRDEATMVANALARIRAAEAALGQGPDAFGLIHADLHYRNLLFAPGTVRPIDFDDCGFGPRLWDLAVMFNEITDWPNYAALRAALLAGYRRVRPLPPVHEAHIDTLIALRRLQDVLWLLETAAHPARNADWIDRVRRSLASVPGLLAAG